MDKRPDALKVEPTKDHLVNWLLFLAGQDPARAKKTITRSVQNFHWSTRGYFEEPLSIKNENPLQIEPSVLNVKQTIFK